MLHFLDISLNAQHSITPEGHGCCRGGCNVIEHAHKGQVLAVLAALFQQGLHRLYSSSTSVQQMGKGSMWGRNRGLPCVGLEDDVDVGTSKAKRVDAHIATTNRQGPIYHLQPPIKKGWDFRVGVVEMQVGGPNPMFQG